MTENESNEFGLKNTLERDLDDGAQHEPRKKTGRPPKPSLSTKLIPVEDSDWTPTREMVRKSLVKGKRDSLGFLETTLPLTSRQVMYLAWFMETDDESESALQIGLTDDELADWGKNNMFVAMLEMCRVQKKEAFKLLTGQMFGKLALVVYGLLDSPDWKAQAEGAKLLGRFQGLLIDKVTTDSKETLDLILEKLREMHPVQIVEVPRRPE